MTTVAVPLKDKTSYHGLYRIKVDHLPLHAVAQLLLTFLFGGLAAASMLLPWPTWLASIFIYLGASYVIGLSATMFRLYRQTRSGA